MADVYNIGPRNKSLTPAPLQLKSSVFGRTPSESRVLNEVAELFKRVTNKPLEKTLVPKIELPESAKRGASSSEMKFQLPTVPKNYLPNE